MSLNIAVIDDQRRDAEKLQRVINQYFDNNNMNAQDSNSIGTINYYPDGVCLLKNFEPGMYDLVFMDIIMSSLNGIDTARQIRLHDNKALLVFTTTSREFAFDAFPLHPFDYVLKPYEPERVTQVLHEALKVLRAPDPVIHVRVSRSTYDIPLRSISSVSSSNHVCEFTLTDGRCVLCSMTFSEIEAVLLNDSRFLVCNRGVIINMDCVQSLTRDKDVFIMKEGSRHPLRVRCRAKLLDEFTQYQIMRVRGEICR